MKTCLKRFIDADAENKGAPPDNMPMYTMLYVATKKEEGYIFEEYQSEMISKWLAEGLSKLHNENDPKELFHYITGYLLNQMPAKVSIKKLGSKAEEALHKEFLQQHNTNTFTPIFERELSPEQIKNILDAISIIKEKRDGSIKGRTCANGKKQRLWKSKAELTSPTVCTDSVFITLMVDAYEGRATEVVDVSRAYLNAEIDEFLVLKFIDEQVNTMYWINVEYKKYVTKKVNKKILCVILN